MNHEIKFGHSYTETDVHCISTMRNKDFPMNAEYIIYNKETTGLQKGYTTIEGVEREIRYALNVESVRG